MATDAGECKQYCRMPLLTDLAVMMRINPLALIQGLREFVAVVYGPVMSFVFPDVQVKAYRNSVLYVSLISVVDCSVLNWVEQKELRGLASDDRLFGRIAEPGWVLMDFNNNFKCRMGREDFSPYPVQPEALESETSTERFRSGYESPTFARGLRTREREPASVAFRVQAAAGPMPPIPTDKKDVDGSYISRHCPSHRSSS